MRFTVLIVYHYHDISFSIDKGSSSDVAGVVAGVVAIILVATGIIVVVVVMLKQKKVMSSLLTITSQYIPPLSFSLQTRSGKYCPPSAVVPTKRGDEESGCGNQNGSSSHGSSDSSSEGSNASCTSFTERGDVESGYGDQSGGSTALIGDQLAEDGSATQAEEEEGKYAVVVPLKSGNRFPHSVDPTAVVYSELNIRATHVS